MTEFGARIASKLRMGDVVALSGDLGTGKTTLARAMITACGHRGEVPSPTYTIIEAYDNLPIPLIHADFYRLERTSEADEIGLDDYREGAALIAEWPEKAGGFSRETNCLSITLKKLGEGRVAIVEPAEGWQSRLP